MDFLFDRYSFLRNNNHNEVIDMYEIDVCYKIIFEAMLENPVLKTIAEKIGAYTNSTIAFVTETGKILSGFCFCDLSAEKLYENDTDTELVKTLEDSFTCGHLTLSNLKAISQRRLIPNTHMVYMEPVYGNRGICGYVILITEEDDDIFFKELIEIMRQTIRKYLEEEQSQKVIYQSFREQITGWTLFENSREINEIRPFPEGNYIVILCQKEGVQDAELFCEMKQMWNYMYFYETPKEIIALCYHISESDAEDVYKTIESCGFRCCVSEPFSSLELCTGKKDILRRISLVNDVEGGNKMKREEEWSMQGLYMCTLPLIEKAGLHDYSIHRLLLEDERNHTELYETLKMYLLCGNNITVAAKMLHIHRNTLVYRLKQIRECLEIDFNDIEISRGILSFILMNDISRQSQGKEEIYETGTGFTGNI